jgi:hypothetical protein
MNTQTWSNTNVEFLMDMLTSENGATRQKAWRSLVALDTTAVSSLSWALRNSSLDHLRWEAAKTLGAIGDRRAIPSLVKALEDSDPDVTWLAAEALKKFKKAAWPSLLRVLVKSDSESVLLRQGAHHVLRNQKEDGFNDLLKTLTKALESSTAQESTPLAASDILNRMKVK